MKYEAVFGNQDLFDGAGTFTGLDVVTRSIASGNMMHCRLSDLTPKSLREYPVIAMRRIIQEPKRWTAEDWKDGRLPEVGAKMMHNGATVKFRGVNIHHTHLWHIEYESGVFDAVYESKIKPLETPEEKADRLRNEWINEAINAVRKTDVNGYESIYDALLSGTLSVPTKGGE